ncbi:MAG: MarR family transcriptional regulator [Bacteroidetes bacterium HGW-Bacteroidetes-2]|jgi:DNA-binding MarR family transcriptional regulator|nr:MAG: MarR family transcriptional regulator [Bacteroidetes bacterium HGW-Bacteroidetes-2]
MKSSPFNLTKQNSEIESKIVVALERVSQVFKVLLWNESKENNLSPIQTQILIFLLFHSRDICKVGYLALEFNITKATVSDSVKSLLNKNLIQKELDAIDSRSFTIFLTPEGEKKARQVASFSEALETPILQLTPSQKESFLESLLTLIENLNKQDILSVQRMCISCRYYDTKPATPYCNLLKKPLYKLDLRIDCPEHQLAV